MIPEIHKSNRTKRLIHLISKVSNGWIIFAQRILVFQTHRAEVHHWNTIDVHLDKCLAFAAPAVSVHYKVSYIKYLPPRGFREDRCEDERVSHEIVYMIRGDTMNCYYRPQHSSHCTTVTFLPKSSEGACDRVFTCILLGVKNMDWPGADQEFYMGSRDSFTNYPYGYFFPLFCKYAITL